MSERVWLVARSDGSKPSVLRAATESGAAIAYLENEGTRAALVCVWQLGNFPAQYERIGTQLRKISRPCVSATIPAESEDASDE